jgi:hypothetical protein
LADNTRTNPAAQRSITSHPLFPVIVVLWCGALFGMASLAIRTEWIEGAVVAAGVDGVVPMAAPPLGKTARILIALLAIGLGSLVGLLVMRRVSNAQAAAPAPVRRRNSAPTVEAAASPVSLFGGARREEGDDAEQEAELAEEAPVAPAGRRRRFTMAREEQPEAADAAPPAQILNVADLDLDSFEPDAGTPRWVRNIDQDAVAVDSPQIAESRDSSLFDSYARRLTPVASAEETSAAPGFELLSQPLAGDLSAADEAPLQAAPVAARPPIMDIRPRAQGSAAERIASAPLDDLSHVELLERLALTIERRRAALRAAAEAAAAAPMPAPAPAQQEDAPAPVAEAEPAAPLPAALQPVDLDAEAYEDEPLPGYVPPRHIGLNAAAAETRKPALPDADDVDDDDVLAEGYSSLRNLSRPAAAAAAPAPAPAPQPPFASRAAPRFGRPAAVEEDRSVFPFPAQPEPAAAATPDVSSSPAKPTRAFDGPAKPKDAEAELRAALATLQRMSGAA